jgi:hypothetical protein
MVVKPCVESELYSVSDTGEVYSRTSNLLKPWIINSGYKVVTFCVDYVKVNYTVHSLVASAFLGPRPPGMIIDHKDSNRLNNCVDNLQYISHAHNNHKSLVVRTSTGYKHITKTPANTWRVQISRGGIHHRKAFKSLSDAIIHRDNWLAQSPETVVSSD